MLRVLGIWHYSGIPYSINNNTPYFTCLVWFSKTEIQTLTMSSSKSKPKYIVLYECAPFIFWNGYLPTLTGSPIEGPNKVLSQYQNNQWKYTPYLAGGTLTWGNNSPIPPTLNKPNFPSYLNIDNFKNIYNAHATSDQANHSLALDAQIIQFQNLSTNYTIQSKSLIQNVNQLKANKKSLTQNEKETMATDLTSSYNYLAYVAYTNGMIVLLDFISRGIKITLEGKIVHITLFPAGGTNFDGSAGMCIFNESSIPGTSSGAHLTNYIGKYTVNQVASTSKNGIYVPPYVNSISLSMKMPVGNDKQTGDIIYGNTKTLDIAGYNNNEPVHFGKATAFKVINLKETFYKGPINSKTTIIDTTSQNTRTVWNDLKGDFKDLWNDTKKAGDAMANGAKAIQKDINGFINKNIHNLEKQVADAIAQVNKSLFNLIFVGLGWVISYCPEFRIPFLIVDVGLVLIGLSIKGPFGKTLVGDATLMGGGHLLGEAAGLIIEAASEDTAFSAADNSLIDDTIGGGNGKVSISPENKVLDNLVGGAKNVEGDSEFDAEARFSSRDTVFARHDFTDTAVSLRETFSSASESFSADLPDLGAVLPDL